MSRSQAVLNAVTVLFLLFLGMSIVLMPRYNYALITSQVAALGGRTTALERGFEKLNILAGPGEEKRAAVLANLDLIATKTRKIDEDLVSFIENSAEEASRLEEALRRLGRIEDLQGSRYAPIGSSPSEGIASSGACGPDGAQLAKAAGITPRRLAQMDFDQFLAFAAERPLTKPREASGQVHASVGLPAGVKPLFESFRACVEAINLNQELFIQELVEKAARTGDYAEEDESEPGERRMQLQAPSEAGTVFVENLGNGRRRVFRLSAEENPEFANFDKLRDKALQSFLVSMSALGGR